MAGTWRRYVFSRDADRHCRRPANDACAAVAEHIAGSEKPFVELMNKRLEIWVWKMHLLIPLVFRLRATSAYDMQCVRGYSIPRIFGIKHQTSCGGKTQLDNTNKLLWWYDGTDGGKTGWTTKPITVLHLQLSDNLRMIAVFLAFLKPEAISRFRSCTIGLAIILIRVGEAGRACGASSAGKEQLIRLAAAPQAAGVLMQKVRKI